jgi:chemotaxis protein CheC
MPTEFPIKHSESDLLTELERDALAELANIGVSRAAASLRKMVGQQVLLSVPSVEVVSHKTAAAVMSEREGDDLIAVRQDFSGSFSGRALLIFPHSNSLVLVRAVVGDDVSHDDVRAMEEEALAETGNIILNGCLATIANMLQLSLEMSLPSVLRGSGPQLLEIEGPKRGEGLVLFLYINFSIKDLDIRGYIAVLMDLPALANLKRLLAEFIERVMKDDTRKVE